MEYKTLRIDLICSWFCWLIWNYGLDFHFIKYWYCRPSFIVHFQPITTKNTFLSSFVNRSISAFKRLHHISWIQPQTSVAVALKPQKQGGLWDQSVGPACPSPGTSEFQSVCFQQILLNACPFLLKLSIRNRYSSFEDVWNVSVYFFVSLAQ